MPVAVNASDWRVLPPDSLTTFWGFPSRNSGVPFPIQYEPLEGGFVPAVPYFLIRRFTRPGWLVYDPMAGAMVTQRVAEAMGRRAISVDLQRRAAGNHDQMYGKLILADAREYVPEEPVDLVIWHPPYRDIIQFSDDPRDLSTMDRDRFWSAVVACLLRFDQALKPQRMIGIVIGDIYRDQEVIPLASQMYYCVKENGFDWQFKGQITKNIEGNRPGQENLWRYRAVAGDTVLFKTEYILLFKKRGREGKQNGTREKT